MAAQAARLGLERRRGQAEAAGGNRHLMFLDGGRQ
jgi:hypothetical protein